ncbi:hypothetical protein Poli38472_011081 [Pythium oligandrum]|uniref:Uncharacterized protein n=1 Tax=Pythium oligandrum TaxID=41045 RepID=A0A8K1CPK2_PYTOL|nr:hypothetical protein Poli38472_011081 [Pythium oligandrum]|eukprot:TMW67461.1 hypothetical protein Poli38472_011081 [Pythium oligandrum]
MEGALFGKVRFPRFYCALHLAITMAELLSSSDDESLVGENASKMAFANVRASPKKRNEGVAAKSAPETASSSRSNASSPKRRTTRRGEPDEELFESLFLPEKTALMAKKREKEVLADFEPWTKSPPSDTMSQASAINVETRPRVTKKPVISARAMLMKFLPSNNTTPPSLLQTTQSSSPSQAASKRQAPESNQEEGSWRKRAKPSASELIAKKYGLLPSSMTQQTTQEEKTTMVPVESQEPEELREESVKKPSPATKRSTWNALSHDAERAEADTDNVQYVSPFNDRRGSFTNMRQRRQRGAGIDKNVIYNDEGVEGVVNRPQHVIGSKIAEKLGENDGDGWLSDAQDLDSDDEATAHAILDKKKLAGSAVSGDSKTRRTASTGRRSKRPRSGSLSDDEDEDVNEIDRWPMLPSPEVSLDPLVLKSPIEGGEDLTVCANINSYLFSYQREGAQFLFNAYAQHTGAILGDEMGLGKTIQVIALLSAILKKQGDYRDKESWRQLRTERRARRSENGATFSENDGPNPLLIVVPASLLHNWESELHVWMSCATVILHGKPEERERLLDQIERGEHEVVICSYDILKITLDRIRRTPWDAVVFDEMHCLKNPESKLTQAVKNIPCKRKLGLTGTLMQNNEKELHCLIDTIAPGVLGSWQQFRSYYGDDIKYGRKKSAAPEAVERSRKKEKKLRQVLVPYYLRREKEINPSFQEVKKRDQVVFCDLTPYQLAAYERILEMPEFELLRRGEELCDCGRDSARKRKECCYQTPASMGTNQRALLWERFHSNGEACNSCPNCMGLVCMAQLLKLSNHMELLKVNPHDPPELQEYQAQFAATALGEDSDAVGGVNQVTTFQEMRDIGSKTCGKMVVLEKLLAVWKRKRQKTLLFSRSTRMLDILQLFLISKAVSYLRLDGNTKVEERLQLVNRFNDPESNISVFLISTRAGGLGLNLPTATNVVIFDPSWNPAHDCQAQDRAYRIGQTKDVQVYRLITLGTIEEMIYVRQIYKQQLSDTTLKGVKAPRYFEGVQGDRRQQGELFGIRNLLCWKEGGVLKGIQDSYRRDQDGLVIQETKVDYDQSKKPRTPRKSKPKHVDGEDEEEMVEVAEEMTTGMISPLKPAKPDKTSGGEAEDSGDDIDTQNLLPQGARTLMHEAIIGDEGHGGDLSSDSDEEEAEYVPDKPTRNIPSSASSPVMVETSNTKRASASGATKTPPKDEGEPIRRTLYIPKYA